VSGASLDFEDTPQEAKFRAGMRAVLAKAAEPRAPGTGNGGNLA